MIRLLDELFEFTEQDRLRLSADDVLHHFPTLEDAHRRDGADAVLHCERRLLIGIEFYDLYLRAVFIGDLFEDRTYGAARATPLRPEIDDDRKWVLQDQGLEIR